MPNISLTLFSLLPSPSNRQRRINNRTTIQGGKERKANDENEKKKNQEYEKSKMKTPIIGLPQGVPGEGMTEFLGVGLEHGLVLRGDGFGVVDHCVEGHDDVDQGLGVGPDT